MWSIRADPNLVLDEYTNNLNSISRITSTLTYFAILSDLPLELIAMKGPLALCVPIGLEWPSSSCLVGVVIQLSRVGYDLLMVKH